MSLAWDLQSKNKSILHTLIVNQIWISTQIHHSIEFWSLFKYDDSVKVVFIIDSGAVD